MFQIEIIDVPNAIMFARKDGRRYRRASDRLKINPEPPDSGDLHPASPGGAYFLCFAM
jgi:hypothetical protein